MHESIHIVGPNPSDNRHSGRIFVKTVRRSTALSPGKAHIHPKIPALCETFADECEDRNTSDTLPAYCSQVEISIVADLEIKDTINVYVTEGAKRQSLFGQYRVVG